MHSSIEYLARLVEENCVELSHKTPTDSKYFSEPSDGRKQSTQIENLAGLCFKDLLDSFSNKFHDLEQICSLSDSSENTTATTEKHLLDSDERRIEIDEIIEVDNLETHRGLVVYQPEELGFSECVPFLELNTEDLFVVEDVNEKCVQNNQVPSCKASKTADSVIHNSVHSHPSNTLFTLHDIKVLDKVIDSCKDHVFGFNDTAVDTDPSITGTDDYESDGTLKDLAESVKKLSDEAGLGNFAKDVLISTELDISNLDSAISRICEAQNIFSCNTSSTNDTLLSLTKPVQEGIIKCNSSSPVVQPQESAGLCMKQDNLGDGIQSDTPDSVEVNRSSSDTLASSSSSLSLTKHNAVPVAHPSCQSSDVNKACNSESGNTLKRDKFTDSVPNENDASQLARKETCLEPCSTKSARKRNYAVQSSKSPERPVSAIATSSSSSPQCSSNRRSKKSKRFSELIEKEDKIPRNSSPPPPLFRRRPWSAETTSMIIDWMPSLDQILLEIQEEELEQIKQKEEKEKLEQIKNTQISTELYAAMSELRDVARLEDTSETNSPFLNIFDVNNGFRYFGQSTIEALWSTVVVKPMSKFDKKLSKVSYVEFISLLESGLLKLIHIKQLNPHNASKLQEFLWLLMSVHSSPSISENCRTSILSFLNHSGQKFVISLEKIIGIFINSGVTSTEDNYCPLPQLYQKSQKTLQRSYVRKSRVDKSNLPERKSIILRNLNQIICTLSSVISYCSLPDEYLSHLALFCAWLACDKEILSKAKIGLVECLNTAIARISSEAWPERFSYLTRELVFLGKKLSSVNHLTDFLLQVPRGLQLQKSVSFCALYSFCEEPYSHVPDVSAERVLSLLKAQDLQKIKNVGLLYDFLVLIDKSIETVPPDQKQTAEDLIHYLSALQSSMSKEAYYSEEQRPVYHLLFLMCSKFERSKARPPQNNFLLKPPQQDHS